MLLPTILAGLALVCYQAEATHCPPAPRNSLTGHKRTPQEMLCNPCDQLFEPNSSFMKECGDFLTTFTINKLTTSCENVHEDEIDKFIQNLQILCQYKGYGPFDEPDEEDCGCDFCELLFDPSSDFMKKCAFDFDDRTKDALRYKCDTADCGTHGMIKLEKYLAYYCASRGRKFRFPSCECDECLMLFEEDSEFMTTCGTSMSGETLDKLYETCSLCMDNVDALFTFFQTLKTMCVWKGFDPFALPVCDCSDFCWHLFDTNRSFYEDCFSQLPFSRRLELFKECRSIHQDAALAQDFIDALEAECFSATGVDVDVPTGCGCTEGQLDLVLVIDNSGSVRGARLQVIKNFVQEILDSVTIGDANTRVGIISYNNAPVVEQSLAVGNTAALVQAAVAGIPDTFGGTNTNDAIIRMTSMFADNDIGNKQIGIVLTDGYSNNLMQTTIDAIPIEIEMFAVGVENANDAELLMIARGDLDRVIKAATIAELPGKINKLREGICDLGD